MRICKMNVEAPRNMATVTGQYNRLKSQESFIPHIVEGEFEQYMYAASR